VSKAHEDVCSGVRQDSAKHEVTHMGKREE